MANIYESMNVRQKLAKARLYFLNQKVKKSGKNMHLEFKYFELEDIVPPAIRIFARVGLTTNIEFTDDKAVMSVFNTDNMEEPPITFTVPYREVKPIISNQGKEVTNPMQALGSSITYLRRYLWMTVLDITEPDDIDATLGADDGTEEEANEFAEEAAAAAPAKKEKKKKAPATTAEREEAKKELTGADGAASEELRPGHQRRCGCNSSRCQGWRANPLPSLRTAHPLTFCNSCPLRAFHCEKWRG